MSIPTISGFDRLVASFAPKYGLARIEAKRKMFRYEAAQIGRFRDTKIYQGTQTPDNPQTQLERVRMMYEVRDLMQNVPLVKAILLKFANYCAGSVEYDPDTGDEGLDRELRDYLKGKFKYATADKRLSLERVAQLSITSILRDGDIGFLKVFDGEDVLLQPIEADRIGHPNQISTDPRYFSGLMIGDLGRVVGVRIYERTLTSFYTNPQDFSADRFCLIFDPMRFDQYRGITAFHACAANIRDAYEIMSFEKQAVKYASSLTAFITNAIGAATESEDFFNVPVPSSPTVPGGMEPRQEMDAGKINFLQQGEDVKFPNANRPSPAWQGFLQLIIRDCCASLDVDYGFVFDATALGGPTARLVSVQSQRTFSRWKRLITDDLLIPHKDAVIGNAILQGDFSPKYAAKYKLYNGKWLLPAHPTIDVGRESQANINENKMALRTAADIYGERGEDWRRGQEQCAKEAAHILALAEKYKVPPAMIQNTSTSGDAAKEATMVETQQEIDADKAKNSGKDFAVDEAALIRRQMKFVDKDGPEHEYLADRLEELTGERA